MAQQIDDAIRSKYLLQMKFLHNCEAAGIIVDNSKREKNEKKREKRMEKERKHI